MATCVYVCVCHAEISTCCGHQLGVSVKKNMFRKLQVTSQRKAGVSVLIVSITVRPGLKCSSWCSLDSDRFYLIMREDNVRNS